MEKNRLFIKLRKIGVVVVSIATLLGLVFAVVTYFSQLSQRNILVEAQVISNDEVTLYAPEAELNARFTYAGEDVKHLWKQMIRFENIKKRTVVGKGKMMNIIGDGLSFSFPENTRLLKIQKMNGNFDGILAKLDSNKFQLQFSQWRKNEYILGCFYVASDIELATKPMPIASVRDIIDGDVKITDTGNVKSQERKYVTDTFPKYLTFVGKIIGMFILGAVSGAAVGFIMFSWKEFIGLYSRIKSWDKAYRNKFYEYLDKADPRLIAELQTYYKNNLWNVPNSIWKSLSLEKYPGEAPFTSPLRLIIATLVAIVILFSSVFMILSSVAIRH